MIASSKTLPSFKREVAMEGRRLSKNAEALRPVGTPLDAAQLKLVVGGSGKALPFRVW